MAIHIQPSRIHGSVIAPPSKSVAQRAFAAAFIRRGKTTIYNAGHSNDELAVLQVLREAGCEVEREGTTVFVNSTDAQQQISGINFQESGLAARMLIPLLALQEQEITFNGTGSLANRPMDFLIQSLEDLGVKVQHENGHLPLKIKGPLKPANIEVNGSASSQAITGLVMAYVAAGVDDVTITVKNPVSKPYLALTVKVLEEMKLPVPKVSDDFTQFHFTKKAVVDGPLEYQVEGDWSGAAMLMVAGAIAGEVRITGLDVFTEQGDKAILQALMDAGVRLSITAERIKVTSAPLKAFHFNATDTPDLFPPLAVLAAYVSRGTSVIEGVHRLKNKESDRAITLQQELGKIGVNITFQDDMMLIEGGALLQGSTVNSCGDHRIAMACAIAALGAAGETILDDWEAVKKSYPNFFTELQSLGAIVSGI